MQIHYLSKHNVIYQCRRTVRQSLPLDGRNKPTQLCAQTAAVIYFKKETFSHKRVKKGKEPLLCVNVWPDKDYSSIGFIHFCAIFSKVTFLSQTLLLCKSSLLFLCFSSSPSPCCWGSWWHWPPPALKPWSLLWGLYWLDDQLLSVCCNSQNIHPCVLCQIKQGWHLRAAVCFIFYKQNPIF